MRSGSAGFPGGFPRNDRRSFVVRFEAVDLRARSRFAFGPGGFKRGLVDCGIELLEEIAICVNCCFDKILCRGQKNRAPLFIVGLKKIGTSPSLQCGGELPAEIPRILESRVDAVSAIGRMAMRSVTRDEDAATAICVSRGNAQIPQADVIEFDIEFGPDGGVQITAKVEILLGRPERNRLMKEPGGPEIDTAKEQPVAV